MGELSAKYKLSENGEIITVNYEDNLPPVEDDSETGFRNKKLVNDESAERFLSYQKNNLKYNGETISSFMSAIKSGNEDITAFYNDSEGGDFESQLFEGPYTVTPKYRLDFNNIFAEDIYASEMEMLSGINISEGLGSENFAEVNQKIFSVIEFVAESFIEIVAAEAIFAANELLANIADNNIEHGVEESFHHSFGEWGTIDVTYLSKFLFRSCNYPNNKTRSVFDVDERIAAFIVGFEAFINTERLVDFEKIFKNRNKNLINREIQNTYGMLAVKDINISGLLGASLHYLADTVSSLTTSGMKQFYLLKRKFAHQSHWRSKELHKAKSRNIENGGNRLENDFDYYLTRLSLYRFKFIAERMNVGLKLVRYYSQNATYDSHNTLENGFNRVGLSKSGKKDKNYNVNFQFNNKNKNFSYIWENEASGNDRSQSTRLRSLPQLFLMSDAFIKSQIDDGKNLTPDKSVMQNFAVYKNADKNERVRLDKDLVKKIENHLDNEYMPFYFHDLRTNEILSFHAFLDNITDSFSPDYTPHSGFGRAEEVKHYNKTTRAINFGFTVAATSKDDHDLMWFQINKMVAMCYPQWTRGTIKSVGDLETIPFSQMPASSPMIRVRIGDVIKSNYSEKAYSRIENIQYDNSFYYGSKAGSTNNKTEKTKAKRAYNENQDKNKFLMPGVYKGTPIEEGVVGAFFGIAGSTKYFHIKEYTAISEIKEKENTYFELKLNGDTYKGYEILADKFSVIESSNNLILSKTENLNNDTFNKESKLANNAKAKSKLSRDKNPITRSFETSSGKGLAGFITSLGVEYNEMPWETAHKGSKAPMMVKLTIAFSPIHDISLGLDHSGMLRAPAYNVGRLNQYLFGEPTENTITNNNK